jgi:hypothetical protein
MIFHPLLTEYLNIRHGLTSCMDHNLKFVKKDYMNYFMTCVTNSM